jgi:hypothetical protein
MAVEHINQVELSRRWRLSPRTIEGWRQRGIGPRFLKVGGRVLYRITDVEAYEAAELRETRPLPTARRPVPLRVATRFGRRA